MKVITQVSFAPGAKGMRISYATMEINDAELITNTGVIGSHLADEQESQLAQNLIAAIKDRIDQEGEVITNDN